MYVPVSIIVPTYGNWWLTERCIAALRRYGLPGQQVIVVDDGSPDETRARLAEITGIEVVFRAENRGFAAACNAGASLARSGILLFLNADTEACPGAVAALVDVLDDPTIGVAGAKLLYPEGGIQHAGLIIDRDGQLRHGHWFRPRDLSDADIARDYPVVTGAAMAVRRADFDALGRFDEAYRNGYEDAELCLRTWRAGARVRYEPRAHFVHVESASTGRFDNEQGNFALFQSRWRAVLDALPRVPPRNAVAITLRGHLDAAGALGDETRRLIVALRGTAPPNRRPVSGLEATIGAVIDGGVGDAVAFVAPGDAQEAAAIVAAAPAQRYWVPTWDAMALLRRAGIAPERIDMWRAGVAAPVEAAGERNVVVAYVSEMTTPRALLGAIRTWQRARLRLEPLGLRFEIRSALPEPALRALAEQARLEAGTEPIGAFDAHLLDGDSSEAHVLDRAATLLLTGRTDRVNRIPLLALALGVDVVTSCAAESELATFACEDAYLACDAEDDLAELLMTSFGTGRRDRTGRARRDVRRRHSIEKAGLRLQILCHRRDGVYDDLGPYAVDDGARRAFALKPSTVPADNRVKYLEETP